MGGPAPLLLSLRLAPLDEQPFRITTDQNQLQIDVSSSWIAPLADECNCSLQSLNGCQMAISDSALIHLAELLRVEAQPPPSSYGVAIAQVLCIYLLRAPPLEP